MSFVGTRPEVVKYVKKYKPEYFATLLLPAGITSEASIKYKDEAELLDAAEDVDEVYITKVLPEKMKYNLSSIRRERVWKVLRPYRMKLLRLAPAKFIHFGTTREILELMSGGVDEYRELGWSRLIGSSIKDSDTAGYNSVLSSRADISKDCYLEVSYVHGEAKVGLCGNKILMNQISFEKVMSLFGWK